MNWVARMALVGGAAELVVAAIAWVEGGAMGLVAALVGGGIATSAQVASVALVGVVFATKSVLPPLWTALGFLAVLLTLLYLETRFLE